MRVLHAAGLDDPRLAHAFFTREGGVSTRLYDSLNCGLGSHDDRANALENRRRAAAHLGLAPGRLVTLYQIHSAEAVIVNDPWAPGEGPRADGMATRTPGLALGVLAADCTPILFADAEEGVIGACHAGWKGALAGIAEATVDAMIALGARRARITAAIGPTIRQPAYEVGADYRDRFIAADARSAAFFTPGIDAAHAQFDLPGYLTRRLTEAGVMAVADVGVCTNQDQGFFSYRRTTHRGEPDYGRNLSAIALKP
ncbi:MAG: peptidoglycan editing factor PgeF [Micropepsaceae bacterium]